MQQRVKVTEEGMKSGRYIHTSQNNAIVTTYTCNVCVLHTISLFTRSRKYSRVWGLQCGVDNYMFIAAL